MQFGYRQVPWLGVTYFCLAVQVILAMLTQIHRKDQVTITVCALGFYMLSYAENTRRKQFRGLVLLIGVSIVQDLLWFLLNRDTEDDEDDGGLERGVKQFSRTMSFVSMVWRVSNLAFAWPLDPNFLFFSHRIILVNNFCFFLQVITAIVLWKISLDFVRVVKNKSVDGDAIGLE